MASLASKLYKIQFRPGLRPVPAGGAYDAPPHPLVGWKGGTSPHSLHPRRLRRLAVDAFGVEPRLRRLDSNPQLRISGYPTGAYYFQQHAAEQSS